MDSKLYGMGASFVARAVQALHSADKAMF